MQVLGCGGAGWLPDGRLVGVGTAQEPERETDAPGLRLREACDHVNGTSRTDVIGLWNKTGQDMLFFG